LSSPKRTARRVPRESRRQLLLEAGEQLAQELFLEGGLDPLLGITPTAIVERAAELTKDTDDPISVSKSQLYYLWGDGMDGFRRDLLLRLGVRSIDPEGLANHATSVQSTDWRQIVAEVADWEFRRLAPGGDDHESMLMYQALVTVAMDPEVREGMTRSTEGFLGSYAQIYDALLAEFGLCMMPGLTTRQLASILSATVEGFAQEARFDPCLLNDVEARDGHERRSLFATTVLAIVAGLTTPAA
jgi:hypothetical protein